MDTLGLDGKFPIKKVTVTKNGDGILTFIMQNYEGMAKAAGALEDGEVNVKVTIYTDYNIKPRPAVKPGMFGMPSKDYNNNNGNYAVETKAGNVTSWWSAFGGGKDNTFRVELLKLTSNEICLNLSASCAAAKGLGASVLNGSIASKF